ncbi:MAG TPA: thiolase family protein [Acidimicrobiia bacterium]|nr:thiolase family protein [Acidimicrobiia bacterium]
MTGPEVAIVGIGIHPFGRHDGVSGRAMGVHAVREALADADAGWSDVDFAFGGSKDGGNADTMVADLGLTGLQFVNVSNGCATGGSALVSAYNAIRAGAGDLGVVVGFDKHPPGAFGSDPAAYGLGAWYGETGLMVTTQFFAMKIQRYMHDHGITGAALARVAAKAFRNGARNPNAWRRKPLSEEDILAAPMIAHPLTQYMFCSPGEGGVALVLARADQASRYCDRPVQLRSAVVRTRRFGSFEVFSPGLALERSDSPSVDAARAAFAQAGIGPDEVQVAQVQDTEAGAEVMHLAECGLCKDGEQEEWMARGVTDIGGALPVNTDGGCLANGEPVGASGLRQVYEVVAQLQGRAGERQVPGDPRVGFTHVYGAPGISACTVLTR